MLETLSFDPCFPNGMGAVRPDSCRDQGLEAFVSSFRPDAGGGVRACEEGPSQHSDGQDDECECDCIVHELLKALGVPKLFNQ